MEVNMLANLIRWYTFQMLIGAIRTRRNHFIEAYWDLVYIYRFGLPDLKVELQIPWPPQPQPDPSPEYWNFGHDILLLDILDLVMGDPNPQPSSWIKLLGSSQFRIAAATNLLNHFKLAIPQLEAEIQRLEGLQ
jgi:hypothetical protein